jgi:isopentenyl-diphosphate delta-isomerase
VETEQVVLLDEGGRAIGRQDKATVHHASTPLHLAFSSYLVDDQDRVLLTQRAHTKRTWPGVWTNSCCGHPLPGEPLEDAVRRRLSDELGLIAGQVDLVLPAFRYRAEMPEGIVENELCPVFRVSYTGDVTPAPAEVAAYRWVAWPEVTGQDGLSPWCVLQVTELARLGATPSAWPLADPALLPPAAQLGTSNNPPHRAP